MAVAMTDSRNDGANPTAEALAQIREALDDRFWSKVDKSGDCWLWIGKKNSNGYGWFWYQGRNLMAHRVLWEHTNGPIENGLLVLHKCDTPACVNPAHLFLGTHTDNMRDAAAKKRLFTQIHPETTAFWGNQFQRPHGEAHGAAKLTEDKVGEIRKLFEEGLSKSELSRRYKVSVRTIGRVVRCELWKHIA